MSKTKNTVENVILAYVAINVVRGFVDLGRDIVDYTKDRRNKK